MALFGVPFAPVPFIVGLFDTYPIGTILAVGEDSGFWVGAFAGLQDGVALNYYSDPNGQVPFFAIASTFLFKEKPRERS